MNILFLLMAALLIPQFESGDDDVAEAGGTPADPDPDPTPTPTTDTASAIAADPTAPALNAATDAAGNTVVQGNGAATAETGTSIMDFVMADPTLSASPIDTLGVDGGAGDDTISVDGLDLAFVSGGAGDDIITGMGFQGSGPDIINGGDGDDTLSQSEGEAYGGAGDDEIFGVGNSYEAAGTSTALFGDDGNDTISLEEDGTAFGGAGNDIITAGGFSTITGGTGDDTLTIRHNGNGYYPASNSSADGGAGDDTVSYNYERQPIFSGVEPFVNLNADVSLTGGAGEDDIIITGVFQEVPVSETSGAALFATVTDFDPSEDTLFIELSGATMSSVTSGFTSNLDVDLVSTVSGAEIGTFDINFTLAGQNAAGETLARAMTIRIEEIGNVEFDFLTITETPNGVAVSIDQTAILAA